MKDQLLVIFHQVHRASYFFVVTILSLLLLELFDRMFIGVAGPG